MENFTKIYEIVGWHLLGYMLAMYVVGYFIGKRGS